MFKISRLTDYSVLILSCLSRDAAVHVSARTLSEYTGIPLPTVSKILKKLSAAEIIVSHRGTQGGYCLVHNVMNISLAQIVEAIEGDIAITPCISGACVCESLSCNFKSQWAWVHQQLYAVISNISLHDIMHADANHKIESPLYFIEKSSALINEKEA